MSVRNSKILIAPFQRTKTVQITRIFLIRQQFFWFVNNSSDSSRIFSDSWIRDFSDSGKKLICNTENQSSSIALKPPARRQSYRIRLISGEVETERSEAERSEVVLILKTATFFAESGIFRIFVRFWCAVRLVICSHWMPLLWMG